MAEDSDKPDDNAGSDEHLACEGDEYVLPGPTLPNGNQLILHHHEDHTITHGVIRPRREGAPLDDSTILFEPREGTPLYNVVGTVGELKRGEVRKGPSKAVSNAYRKGWDSVFGNKPSTDLN
jgi:hypothetical protein